MNLRALGYLVALAECRNFSRAAERCCVTQSTLSIQVRKLEDYLGVVLIERTRARIALTPAGKQITMLARMILATSHEIQDVARRARIRNESQVTAAEFPPNPLIDDINCHPASKG